MTPLLDSIQTPADVRQLSPQQLPALANELRSFLIETVGKTGGHFSSNLGTVELTVALHYVFNTPHDRLVWDVGHQTYPHKIFTGRRDRMGTFSFDWSPDGCALVISTNRSPDALLEPARSELRILGVGERGIRVERDIELRGLPEGPKTAVAWSPDGTRIAWAGRRGHEGLYSPENLELWALDLT